MLLEYSTGKYTLDGIAREAYSWGLRSKRSNRVIGKQSVRRMLENPFYYGQFRLHSEFYDGNHEPLIEKSTYERNQDILKGRSKTFKVRYDFMYKGLVKCDVCGYSIIGETKKGHTYYRCSKRGGNCEQSGVREEELMQQTTNALDAIHIDDETWGICMDLLKENMSIEVEQNLNLRKQWQAELNEVDRRMKRLLDLRVDGEIEEVDFKIQKSEYAQQRNYLGQKLTDNQMNVQHALELGEKYFSIAKNAKNLFEQGNLETKKNLLQTVGWNLRLKDKTLDFHYAEPFDAFVNCATKSTWRE